MTKDDRSIIPAIDECEEPPELRDLNSKKPYLEALDIDKTRAWKKWFLNYGFMLIILALMFIVYFVDMHSSGGSSSLKEPLFEVLKVTLFSVSGYVFARSKTK